jgi:hypothetical protein
MITSVPPREVPADEAGGHAAWHAWREHLGLGTAGPDTLIWNRLASRSRVLWVQRAAAPGCSLPDDSALLRQVMAAHAASPEAGNGRG